MTAMARSNPHEPDRYFAKPSKPMGEGTSLSSLSNMQLTLHLDVPGIAASLALLV